MNNIDWDDFVKSLEGADDSEKLDAILEIVVAVGRGLSDVMQQASSNPLLRGLGIGL